MLVPGDVLLVSGAGLLPRLIRHAQERGGFHPRHARWTHASLYIGRGRVVEATPFGGVRIGQLAAATFGRELLVRRRVTTPDLVTEQRCTIAIEALTALRRGYSLTEVPRLAWQAWRGRLWSHDQRPNIGSVTICSTVVNNAYMTAVYTDLAPGIVGVLWPADLSLTDALTDIPVGWVRVAG